MHVEGFWESGYEGKLERLFHFPCSKDERRADARFSKDIQSENVCRSFARIEGRHLVRWWVFKCDKLAGLRSDCFVGGETLRVRLVYRDHLNLKTLLLSVQVISSME